MHAWKGVKNKVEKRYNKNITKRSWPHHQHVNYKNNDKSAEKAQPQRLNPLGLSFLPQKQGSHEYQYNKQGEEIGYPTHKNI